MVPSPGPKLDDVLSLVVREIRFLVHVLSPVETECYQSFLRPDGKIRDHQGFQEAVWDRPAAVGFC